MTEYGLAPINSHPSFTVVATPAAAGTSRRLAPEIMTPTRKGNGVPVVESKAADVFAFGMLAVEVFSGKIPFEEQKNEAVVLRISRGGRPKMPDNAQAVGLTDEMWKLLESCWHQNPKRRPTMEEIVRRWQRFDDDSDVATECVQITPVIPSSSSVPFSASVVDPGNRYPRPVTSIGQGLGNLNLQPVGPPNFDHGLITFNLQLILRFPGGPLIRFRHREGIFPYFWRGLGSEYSRSPDFNRSLMTFTINPILRSPDFNHGLMTLNIKPILCPPGLKLVLNL